MRDLSWHCGTGIARLEWKCVKCKPLSITLQSALVLLFPGCYQNSELQFYLLICFYFYRQLGLWMLLKAGRAAEVPHPYLCLEHSCSTSQKCGTRELNWASEARAVLWHCVSSGLGSVLRRIPTHCLWEQMNSGESKGKWGTTCGVISSPHSLHHIVTEA